MNNGFVMQWGPWFAIALFVLKWARDEWRSWQSRQWTKEDTSKSKTHELYERLLEQQRDTLTITDRNTDALESVQSEVAQLRRAIETEMPQLLTAVRDLTAQVARGRD